MGRAHAPKRILGQGGEGRERGGHHWHHFDHNIQVQLLTSGLLFPLKFKFQEISKGLLCHRFAYGVDLALLKSLKLLRYCFLEENHPDFPLREKEEKNEDEDEDEDEYKQATR